MYYKNQTKDQKEITQSIISGGYLKKGQSTLSDIFNRVSDAFATDNAHKERIFTYLENGWFLPATPILSYNKNGKGLPISCFLNEMIDNFDDIVQTQAEGMYLTAIGGGVGTDMSNIRESGARIGDDGQSAGVVPFIISNAHSINATAQNSVRRGAVATYLHISHPEVQEFIKIRTQGGEYTRKLVSMPSAHHGIIINDEFMEALRNDEKWYFTSRETNKKTEFGIKARELWQNILKTRIETGEAYILFEDTVNRMRPDIYKKLDLKVKTSNLCVAPETLILTSNGWKEIQSCANEKTTIWNGFEWSDVVPIKTGENQKLLTIKTNDGQELVCTNYHKWYVQTQDSFGGISKIICKRTHELEVGDKIIKYNFPVINGTLELPYAYANGFYSGDGCQLKNGKSRIYLYNDKRKCEPRLSLPLNQNFPIYVQEKQNRKYIDLPSGMLEYKFFVPNADYSIGSRLEWFAGLCDTNGTIARNGQNQSLQIASVNKQFLLNIQKMLQEIGCKSRVHFVKAAGKYLMPKNDGTGQNAYYNCKEAYRILIDSNELYKLVTLGLKFNRLHYELHLPQRQFGHFIQVSKIINNGRTSDTYCFTESKRNMAVFNGILTGNCSEITLTTGIDHLGKKRTAVCCLSSLNLYTYDEWKGNQQFIKDVLIFLDNVLQVFIDKAPDRIINAKYSAMRERSVGLGVMGFHSYLMRKSIAIESDEAFELNKDIFSWIKEVSDVVNYEVARERGACPDAVDAGIQKRWTHMLAIAPTATIGKIAGQVSQGIEPSYSAVYQSGAKNGSGMFIEPAFEELLTSKGITDNLLKTSICRDVLASNGDLRPVNVKHGYIFTPHEIEVFKPFRSLDMVQAVIRLAGERQKYICQGQSLNVFCQPTIAKEELHKIHWEAWKQGVKALYYCRSETENSLVQEECVVCQ